MLKVTIGFDAQVSEDQLDALKAHIAELMMNLEDNFNIDNITVNGEEV